MGKFFNGKVKNNRETLVKYGVIGVGSAIILIILIVIISSNGSRNKAQVTLNKTLKVEINSSKPEIADYFKEYKNYNINDTKLDDSALDITKVGDYEVSLKIKSSSTQKVTVSVYDDTAPVLELKDLIIAVGEEYEAMDFVYSCEDNSKDDCTVSFYSDAQDQDGNLISFDNYKEVGQYTVAIVAYDNQGNMSQAQTANLTIKQDKEDKSSETPKVKVECNYGDLSIPNYVNYPVAVIVGDETNGCALDRNLFDDETVQKKVNEIIDYDNTKLKNQMNNIKAEYTNGAKIVVYPYKVAIFNEDLTGLIGYAVYVKVYVSSTDTQGDINTDANLKLAYYINSDKTRKYDTNVYNFAN